MPSITVTLPTGKKRKMTSSTRSKRAYLFGMPVRTLNHHVKTERSTEGRIL